MKAPESLGKLMVSGSGMVGDFLWLSQSLSGSPAAEHLLILCL